MISSYACNTGSPVVTWGIQIRLSDYLKRLNEPQFDPRRSLPLYTEIRFLRAFLRPCVSVNLCTRASPRRYISTSVHPYIRP
eukprot:1077221-Rhodomonas_salina.1